jgi:Protein of unknown function (DUF2855)
VKATRFALTANNITYAVIGEELKYWQLFPAPEGYGNVPVRGFGEVIAAKHPGIAVGPSALREACVDTLQGRVSPKQGLILSLAE